MKKPKKHQQKIKPIPRKTNKLDKHPKGLEQTKTKNLKNTKKQ